MTAQAATELAVYTGTTPAIRTARRWLQAQNEAIARRLAPFGMGAERYQALVLSELVRSEPLQQCMATDKGQISLQMAVFSMAQLGMEPGPLGHAYLLPFFRDREHYMAATFVLGWKGMVQLALRSPDVKFVDVHPVYPEDRFEFKWGTNPGIIHVPKYEGGPNYDRLTHVYAVCQTRSGGKPFVVLTKAQVEHYRRLSKQPNGEAWSKHPVAMAQKTAVRRGFPLWPVRIQDRQAVAEDEEREEGIGEDEPSPDGHEPDGKGPGRAPVRGGPDRRRRKPAPEAPPDEPAAPGRRETEPPPQDTQPEPAKAGTDRGRQPAPPPDQPVEREGGSMTPLQFLDFVCKQSDIDREALVGAVAGGRPTSSTAVLQEAIKFAQEITRGEARLVDLGGVWHVLPVVDGEPQ